ncbi:polyprenyl synthetase family protein [Candidatus Bipolaricaulota sp. J31]
MEIPEILRRYRGRIVPRIEEALGNESPLGEMLAYHMGLREAGGSEGPGIGGKLLRPSLVCFSCEALGEDFEKAIPFACALELVHNFSLIHDDVQDRDELRRGRPTVWKVFGMEQAINAGDGMFALAFRVALAARRVLREEAVLQGLDALLSATYRMIEGQVLDLSLEGKDAGVKEYLEMARRKTGALIGCALELGAIAAGVDETIRGRHRELGEALGLAFQIRDDWIGIWGDPEVTGKPVGSDLTRRKRSFPVAFALERDPSLGGLLARDPVPVEEVLARLEALGAEEATRRETARYAEEAERMMTELPWEPWARDAFRELLSFLVEREA